MATENYNTVYKKVSTTDVETINIKIPLCTIFEQR